MLSKYNSIKNHKINCTCAVCKLKRGIRTSRIYGPLSMDYKNKISIANKGKHNSPKTEFKANNIGETSPHWKGGITNINKWIRVTIPSKDWIKKVFERDNYTCQHCGKRECGLEAHHIIPFSKILKEFLNKYIQYNPIKDIEILVRLSETYKPFWNIDNGKTLCYECHNKLPKYGGRPCV